MGFQFLNLGQAQRLLGFCARDRLVFLSGLGWLLCSGIGWISIPELVRGRVYFFGSGLMARVFFHWPL